jgi:hypothetical protein
VPSDSVVLIAPLLDDDPGFLQAVEDLLIEAFVARFAVEGLAISVLPLAASSMYSVFDSGPASQFRTILDVISAPLSERMCSGMPLVSITLASVSMTPRLLMRRATRMAKHSRVNSSIKVSTWLWWVGPSRMHDPSLSHNRLRG